MAAIVVPLKEQGMSHLENSYINFSPMTATAALLEAVLIGMTKLVVCCSDMSIDIVPSLSKAREGTSSSLIKHVSRDEKLSVKVVFYPGTTAIESAHRHTARRRQRKALIKTISERKCESKRLLLRMYCLR